MVIKYNNCGVLKGLEDNRLQELQYQPEPEVEAIIHDPTKHKKTYKMLEIHCSGTPREVSILRISTILQIIDAVSRSASNMASKPAKPSSAASPSTPGNSKNPPK